MTTHEQDQPRDASRRDFIKTSAAGVATTLAANFPAFAGAHAAGSDTIRVGLVGCGGRGTGAVGNVIESAPGVKLVAMGDAFQDRLDESYANLLKKYADKMDVPAGRRFVGFDAYEKVIASDVNYVILASPPAFRPQHLKAAIAAGRHVFTEKPVAVDGAGIRACLALYEEAKAKGLGVAAGTQRRHQAGYIETLKRVQDGAIGQIVAARGYWNQGALWHKPRQQGWTDMEWQLRNWLYFTWLSGDHIVEQHVHNLDVVNWAMGTHPASAVGMGGRQQRTDAAFGHIYDHFAVDYEYPNGMHLMSMCRQQAGTASNVSEALVGTKGNCQVNKYLIEGATNWKFANKEANPYVQEHTDLIESIRAAKPINELKAVAESTLTAIMGRMSAYTGKAVTWEQALNSKEVLVPARLEWGSLPVPPVAIPGQTPLV
jgi:myo-inositol 2-dehydrogenase / D-chiro-inositol 1-dehydrogenase